MSDLSSEGLLGLILFLEPVLSVKKKDERKYKQNTVGTKSLRERTKYSVGEHTCKSMITQFSPAALPHHQFLAHSLATFVKIWGVLCSTVLSAEM